MYGVSPRFLITRDITRSGSRRNLINFPMAPRQKTFFNLSKYQREKERQRTISYQLIDQGAWKLGTWALSPFSWLFWRSRFKTFHLNFNHWNGSHAGIFGKTGSGKSTLVGELYFNFLKYHSNESSVLIDPHGDLAKSVIKHQNTKDVIYLSPFLENCHQWVSTPVMNPFDLSPDWSNPVMEEYAAFSLADTLNELTVDMSANMRIALQACCLTLMKMKEVNLGDLVRFQGTSTAKPYIRFARANLKNPELIHFFETHFSSAKKTREAISFRLMSLLSSSAFREMTCGKNTIYLSTLLSQSNRSNHLVFDLSGLPQDRADAMGKFILSTLKALFLQRSLVGANTRKPIRLWLDEGPRYMGQSFASILQEARKFGLSTVFTSQSYLQQLPPKVRESMRTNTSIKIMGRASYQSAGAFSDDTQVDQASLLNLRKHQFYYHYDDQPRGKNYFFRCPLQFFQPRNLHRTRLNNEQWEIRKRKLLGSYYRKVSDRPETSQWRGHTNISNGLHAQKSYVSAKLAKSIPSTFYPLHP